jgi:hypothetical protein
MSDTSGRHIGVSVVLLLVGAIIGGLVEELLDYRRELRENTQSFVETFNSAYFGSHRDRLHIFSVEPATIEATAGTLTREKYADWLKQQVLGDPSLSASIFAIAEFYRTVDNCRIESRCSGDSIQNAFSPYASIFYDVFYLALRQADCDYGFPDTERATARIAKLSPASIDLCGTVASIR